MAELRLGLSLAKPYPMWGWITVNFRGDRDYGQVSNQSGDMDTSASMTLKGDFLPTQTLYCQAINYGVEAGPIYTPYGTEYTVQHNNPACDSHPTLNKSPDPRSTSWISEELHNSSGFLVSAFQQGAYYWGDVGSQLSYSELSTPPNSEVGVYPLEDDPNSWGQYIQGGPSPTGRTIGLNWYHHTTGSFEQWAYAAGHELGHAVGFGGDGFGDTIMDEFSGGRVGLIPRTLDKCGAVKAFPVPLL